MKRCSLFGDLTSEEVEELNRATDTMRRNVLRAGEIGDVEGYLRFLEDRQALYGENQPLPKRNSLVINTSSIL